MGDESVELKTLAQCQEILLVSIRNNLEAIASFMRKSDIISKTVFSDVTNPRSMYSPDVNARTLQRKLEDKVEEDVKHYTKFVDFLRTKEDHYKAILLKLDEQYLALGGNVQGKIAPKSHSAAAGNQQLTSATSESIVTAPAQGFIPEFSPKFTAEELAEWLKNNHDLPEGACKIIVDESIKGNVFTDLKEKDAKDLGFNFGARKIILSVQEKIKTKPVQVVQQQNTTVGPVAGTRTELKSDHYAVLCEQLVPVKFQWNEIAMALGFKGYEIENIRRKIALSYSNDYIYDVIEIWLRWAPGDGRESKDSATLEALQAALNRTNNANIKLKLS